MALTEEDYYYLHAAEPSPPVEGYILLQKVPYSNVVKFIYPKIEGDEDHQTVYIHNDSPEALKKMVAAGIPEEKLDKTLDYLWNLNKVYVATDNWRPKIAPRDIQKKEPSKIEILETLKQAIALLTDKEKKGK